MKKNYLLLIFVLLTFSMSFPCLASHANRIEIDPDCVQPLYDSLVGTKVPEFKCLPREIPAHWAEDKDYLEYQTILSEGERIPIHSGSIAVSGENEAAQQLVDKNLSAEIKNFRDEEIKDKSDPASDSDMMKTVIPRLTDQYLPKFFEDRHYVWMPPGASIHSRMIMVETSTGGGPQPLPLWSYPVGIRLIHVINWRTADGPVFYELRLMTKLKNGIWAYGAYVPGRESANHELLTLRLRMDAGAVIDPVAPEPPTAHTHDGGPSGRLETWKVILPPGPTGGGEEVYKLKFQRQSTSGCRKCHMNHGNAGYMWGVDPPVEKNLQHSLAGPCGLNPSNPNLTSWLDLFFQERGYPGIIFDPVH